jgi:predicted AlkP superfamily pyrophosphatase or phosphodiesterase
VVDGLPSALVFGEPAEGRGAGMPYATELMHSGVAAGYRLRARPPTVTLPRLKALTAGVISSFLDVFFNFAASELTHDSWLRQMHLRGWPMVRYPSHFTRGVQSMKVKRRVVMPSRPSHSFNARVSWRTASLPAQ